MDIKKYKTPFLIMIAILAFLEIMFLLKLLFADSKGFEWGSVSDWVSAFCNIAMASAAVYAAKNAKHWIHQKDTESIYKLANELVNTDLNELFNAFYSTYLVMFKYTPQNINFKNLIRSGDLSVFTHQMDILSKDVISLWAMNDLKFRQVNQLGYKPDERIKSVYRKISKVSDIYRSDFYYFWYICKQINQNKIELDKDSIGILDDYYDNCCKAIKEIEDVVTEFNNNRFHFMDYFKK